MIRSTSLFIVLLSFCILFVIDSYHSLSQFRKTIRTHLNSKILFGDTSESDEQVIEDAIGGAVGPLPTSSRVNFGDQTPKNIKYDLWVVGAGTLGTLIAKQWKAKYPNAKIIAETKTEKRHSSYADIGITPVLRSNRLGTDDRSARNVVVALPPSGANEYLEEINLSSLLYAGPLGNGSLVFTSSIGIYGDSFGNTVNEAFRVDSRSQKTKLMISAEEPVLSRDGMVLRLAGLYDAKRGPHTFWLTNGTVQGAPDSCLNMLHYEDAARAVIACLEKGTPGGIYLACDDVPMSRSEICQAAINSNLFPNAKMPVFTQENGLQAKICDDSFTRNITGWKPLYKSFGEYMVKVIGGKPNYILNPLIKGKPRPCKPINSSSGSSDGSGTAGVGKPEVKKSLLWLPGDEDDLL